MVAQVGASDLPAQRRKGQHLVPLDTTGAQAATEILVAGDRAHAVVVDEEAHGDATSRRALEGLIQGGRVLVPGRLVVQEVHVMRGRIYAGGHRPERVGGVIVELSDPSHRCGETAQVSRQAHDRRSAVVRACGQAVGSIRHLVGHGLGRGRGGHDGVDELAGLRIIVQSAPHRPPRTKDEVERHAHEGPQEDQKQPRGRGRGATVLRHDAQGDSPDGELEGP